MASIGRDLDLALAEIKRRITCIEQAPLAWKDDVKNLSREVGDLNSEAATFATYAQLKETETELKDRIAELVDHEISERVNGDLERIEAELNDRIDELEGFDPDDLRCDLETEIEDVRDGVSYMESRIDEIESYKVTEEEVEDIVQRMLDDNVSCAVTETLNDEFVEYSDYWILQTRVQELEDRLNKPSLGARVLRWLREGPSIKEVATNWYAGIRRGS